MRTLTDVLIWFVVSVAITISLGWVAIITPLVITTLKTLIWVFYALIIIDGVLFITLLALIINSITKKGFE